ncbi:MAG: fused MFS/spermidine synthase [Gammaproteobacteria bacterium]|nr:fused MFS/spermidine synthase [Gammaproteobacteria bacterium]
MRLSVIFITGAAILALQLIASRVMTPYFGVSLFIWTSILSITLLFLALGYAIGGKVTHKIGVEQMAIWYHAAAPISALCIVISCLLYPLIFHPLALWDLVMGSFVACLILLALPLFLLSALNPLLVALDRDGAEAESGPTDSGSGYVFFISTMGSVAGVLVAAFAILPYHTNYQAMLVTALLLGITTLFTTPFEHHLTPLKKGGILALALAAVISSMLLYQRSDYATASGLSLADGENWHLVADIPSPFGTLKVVDWKVSKREADLSPLERLQIQRGEKRLEDLTGVGQRRMLLQNGLVQNMVILPQEPATRVHSLTLYTYVLQAIALSLQPEADTALILGAGGGVVAGELRDLGLKVDVVDIDPAMFSTAKEYFQFDDRGITLKSEDARTYVHSCQTNAKAYDIIIIDLFHSTAGVPEHLVTREFFSDIRQCLTANGAISVNFVMVKERPQPYYTFLATLSSVFGETFTFYRGLSQGAINAFMGARRDGKVTATLADPEILHDLGEEIPVLNSDSIPLAMLLEFEASVNRTQKIITPESAEIAHLTPVTDENNHWYHLNTPAQMQHQSEMVARTDPALLVN